MKQSNLTLNVSNVLNYHVLSNFFIFNIFIANSKHLKCLDNIIEKKTQHFFLLWVISLLVSFTVHTTHFTSATSGPQMCGSLPHTKQCLGELVGCATTQLSSDTTYLEAVSDSPGWGLGPTRLPAPTSVPQMPAVSLGYHLCFWPAGCRLEIPMTSSLESICWNDSQNSEKYLCLSVY